MPAQLDLLSSLPVDHLLVSPLSPLFPTTRSSPLQPMDGLMSPIHLTDSLFSPLPPSCVPTSRRRSKPASQSARRRRLAPRVQCRPSHAFDGLPWISTLEADPDLLNPSDIADLSLIPDADISSSGPGPVRSRKSSLRSCPIGPAIPKNTPSSPPPSSLPIRDTSLLPPSSVSTPKSRFIPSRVLFHNLMPVSYDCHPDTCITTTHLSF